MSKNVSIILSTFNEKLSIEFTISELIKYLPGVEIIVVDDCSLKSQSKKCVLRRQRLGPLVSRSPGPSRDQRVQIMTPACPQPG